ncbi:MAG: ATP-binding protein [Elusimicrobiota bacterium]
MNEEVRDLRRALSDLAALSALPALWAGRERDFLARSLVETLSRSLTPGTLVYAGLKFPEEPAFAFEAACSQGKTVDAAEARRLGAALAPWLKPTEVAAQAEVPHPSGSGTLRLLVFLLRHQEEFGYLAAGWPSPSLPSPIDRLILAAIAGQAAIALQNMHLMSALGRQARLLESANDAVILVDEGDVIRLWNKGAEKLLGWSREEALGRRARDLLKTGFPVPFEIIKEAVRRRGEWAGELTHTTRAGASVAVVSHWTAEIDESAGPGLFLQISRDVTAQKQAEAAERIQHGRLRLLAEAAELLLAARDPQSAERQLVDKVARHLDADGHCVFAADAAGALRPEIRRTVSPEEAAAGAAEETDGRGPSEAAGGAAGTGGRARVFQRLEAEGRVLGGLAFFRRREVFSDDERELVRTFCHYVSAARRRGRITKDLETRVEERTAQLTALNAELSAARDQALASARFKAQFLANMSHEIRTPLNAVIGMSGLLLNTPLAAGQKEFAEVIRHAGDALLSVVNNVLDFSKLEAGKMALARETFSLARLVRETAEIFRLEAERKGITLRVSVGEGLESTLEGDPSRLRQVVMNILANALKFTDRGKVEVSVRAEREEAGRLWARLAVRDTGIGIAPEDQRILFKPFTQADGSLTRKFGGTGLGLAISRQIVRLMDGEIGLESAPGRGSTFWFRVPLVKRLSIDENLLPHSPAAAAAAQRRILVVEDNSVNSKVAMAQLHSLGAAAEAVADGEQAILAWERGGHDLILMDCQMPVMDGYAASREIRRREAGRRRVPIVAMTAHAMEGDREKCLAAGMDDYIVKPVHLEELKDVLARHAPRTAAAAAADDGTKTL